jgi:hypothetical protein
MNSLPGVTVGRSSRPSCDEQQAAAVDRAVPTDFLSGTSFAGLSWDVARSAGARGGLERSRR